MQGVIVSIITNVEAIKPVRIDISSKGNLNSGTYLSIAKTNAENVIYLVKFFKFIYNKIDFLLVKNNLISLYIK